MLLEMPLKYPQIRLENLQISKDYSFISGTAKVIELSYNSDFKVLTDQVIKEEPFFIPNSFQKNFHQLLKLHAENLILEYFISLGKDSFVYDYNKHLEEVTRDQLRSKLNVDLEVISNSNGIYYVQREDIEK